MISSRLLKLLLSLSSMRYVTLSEFTPLCSQRILICTTMALKKCQLIVRYSIPCELGRIKNYPMGSFLSVSIAGPALMFLNFGWEILLKSALIFFCKYFSYLTSITGLSYLRRSKWSLSRSINGWSSFKIEGKELVIKSYLVPSCLSWSLWG